jgi:hypothetical protein
LAKKKGTAKATVAAASKLLSHILHAKGRQGIPALQLGNNHVWAYENICLEELTVGILNKRIETVMRDKPRMGMYLSL